MIAWLLLVVRAEQWLIHRCSDQGLVVVVCADDVTVTEMNGGGVVRISARRRTYFDQVGRALDFEMGRFYSPCCTALKHDEPYQQIADGPSRCPHNDTCGVSAERPDCGY